MIFIQGYIQDYDVAQCGVSVTSELTEQSGSLTHLESDLGRECQKYICTIPFWWLTSEGEDRHHQENGLFQRSEQR
jgi:hypothetical protein